MKTIVIHSYGWGSVMAINRRCKQQKKASRRSIEGRRIAESQKPKAKKPKQLKIDLDNPLLLLRLLLYSFYTARHEAAYTLIVLVDLHSAAYTLLEYSMTSNGATTTTTTTAVTAVTATTPTVFASCVFLIDPSLFPLEAARLEALLVHFGATPASDFIGATKSDGTSLPPLCQMASVIDTDKVTHIFCQDVCLFTHPPMPETENRTRFVTPDWAYQQAVSIASNVSPSVRISTLHEMFFAPRLNCIQHLKWLSSFRASESARLLLDISDNSDSRITQSSVMASAMFSGVIATAFGLKVDEERIVSQLVERYGGRFVRASEGDNDDNALSVITHIIVTDDDDASTLDIANSSIHIATLQWLNDCITIKRLLPLELYYHNNHNQQQQQQKKQNQHLTTATAGVRNRSWLSRLLLGSTISPFCSTVDDNKLMAHSVDTLTSFLRGATVYLSITNDNSDDHIDALCQRLRSYGVTILSQSPVVINNIDVLICHTRDGNPRDHQLVSAAVRHNLSSSSSKQILIGNFAWLQFIMDANVFVHPMRSPLFFPHRSLPIPGFESQQVRIAISDSCYSAESRAYLERLVLIAGAELAESSTDHYTHLIAASSDYLNDDSTKSVISHIWLEDCVRDWTYHDANKQMYRYLPAATIQNSRRYPSILDSVVGTDSGSSVSLDEIERWLNECPCEEPQQSILPPSSPPRLPPSSPPALPMSEPQLPSSELSFLIPQLQQRPQPQPQPQPQLQLQQPVTRYVRRAAAQNAASNLKSVMAAETAFGDEMKSVAKRKRTKISGVSANDISLGNFMDIDIDNYDDDGDNNAAQIVNQSGGDSDDDDDDDDDDNESDSPAPIQIKTPRTAGGRQRRMLDPPSSQFTTPTTQRLSNTISSMTINSAPSSSSSLRVGKPKLESAFSTISDDFGDIASVSSQTPTKSTTTTTAAALQIGKSTASAIRILCTGYKPPQSLLSAIRSKLKACKITSDAKTCTHLVTTAIARTEKFLCAMSTAHFFVTPEWLTQSAAAGYWLDERQFPVVDPKTEQKYGFKLQTVLRMRDDKSNNKRSLDGYGDGGDINGNDDKIGWRLYDGWTVIITPKTEPKASSLKPCIECAGGIVTTHISTKAGLQKVVTAFIQDVEDLKKRDKKASYDGDTSEIEEDGDDDDDDVQARLMVVSCVEDSGIWRDVYRPLQQESPEAAKRIKFVTTEAVLVSLLKLSLDDVLEQYSLNP
ncbi:hypothetical protein GQ42DRAFT_12801 [Ramicandelaber brevisporus]|nr:hypothetical protein GQ42DRAFT_12801 [Ramicandelaber brevisporus]